MNRRPILAVAAAATLALTGALAASTMASASTPESCTISLPSGRVHVTADWQRSGLTKTGFVWISAAGSGPVRLITDRVAWQRGAAGMVSPGAPRSWTVSYPVGFYNHARVIVQDTSGTVRGCLTS